MSQAAIHQNSSDSTPIASVNLSPAQAQVAAALAQGHTVTAASREAGVHRTTVHHWFRHEPDFKAAVIRARREYAATLNDDLRELSALALETLRSLLEDPTTPPGIRLKASLAVLQRPPGWSLPEPIDSPPEREAVDELAEIEAEPGSPAAVAPNAPVPCGPADAA